MHSPDTLSPDAAFVRRLAAHHHSRALAPFRRWQYPAVDPAVIAITEGSSRDDYLLFAMVGKVFTVWHSGRADVRYGRAGTGLGRAMRQIGRSGAYGPRDPGAVRTIEALLLAETPTQLMSVLNKVGTGLSGADHPPHWETLIADLRAWHDPARRDDVRLRWGQQFHTNTLSPAPAN